MPGAPPPWPKWRIAVPAPLSMKPNAYLSPRGVATFPVVSSSVFCAFNSLLFVRAFAKRRKSSTVQ